VLGAIAAGGVLGALSRAGIQAAFPHPAGADNDVRPGHRRLDHDDKDLALINVPRLVESSKTTGRG
jgi:hypothetical protein